MLNVVRMEYQTSYGRRLKRFRRIFTRFDKLDVIFLAFVHFALIIDVLMGTDPKITLLLRNDSGRNLPKFRKQ